MTQHREASSIRVKSRITFIKYNELVENNGEIAELHVLSEKVVNDADGIERILERSDRPEFGRSAKMLLDQANARMTAMKKEQQIQRAPLQDEIDQLDAIVNPA